MLRGEGERRFVRDWVVKKQTVAEGVTKKCGSRTKSVTELDVDEWDSNCAAPLWLNPLG